MAGLPKNVSTGSSGGAAAWSAASATALIENRPIHLRGFITL
jgi:hypothetical protein